MECFLLVVWLQVVSFKWCVNFGAKLAPCEAPQVCGVAVMACMCAMGDVTHVMHAYGGWHTLLCLHANVVGNIHMLLL